MLPRIEVAEIESELAREARALAAARGGVWMGWSLKDSQLPAEAAVIDDLVTLNQVAPLAGISKRSLERHLRHGRIPEPDVRGGGGKPHKWFWKKLRPGLSAVAERPLPEQFPAGRII